ncbi:MAG: 2-oxoacid:acceptor oxidoreductase family protein [Candidatus Natronoplasma sp.]
MRKDIRLCGKGGQGIMLSGFILGKAASVYHDYNAVQMQSYGPEARGGAARSEVVISDEEIGYCGLYQADYMMAMSQEAYDKYHEDIPDDAILLLDDDLVTDVDHDYIGIPGTAIAEDLGAKIVANIVMLGAFNEAGDLVPQDSLEESVENSVPSRFKELNLEALRERIGKAKEML